MDESPRRRRALPLRIDQQRRHAGQNPQKQQDCGMLKVHYGSVRNRVETNTICARIKIKPGNNAYS